MCTKRVPKENDQGGKLQEEQSLRGLHMNTQWDNDESFMQLEGILVLGEKKTNHRREYLRNSWRESN